MSGAANNPYFEISREPSRDDLLRIMTAPNAVANGRASSGASHKEVLCNMTNKSIFWQGGTLSPGLPKAVWNMIVQNMAALCPYRIGDYLQTENPTNPALSWPGTSWVQVQNRMLMGASDTYPVGSEAAKHSIRSLCQRFRPSASAPRMGDPNPIRIRWLIRAICTNSSLRQVRQHRTYDPSSG